MTFNLTREGRVSLFHLYSVTLVCSYVSSFDHLPFAVFASLFVTSIILLRLWANKIEHSWPCIFFSAHLLRQHFSAVRFSAGWEVTGRASGVDTAPVPELEPFVLVLLVKFKFHFWAAHKAYLRWGCANPHVSDVPFTAWLINWEHYFTGHLAHVFHPPSCETSFPNRPMHHLCK